MDFHIEAARCLKQAQQNLAEGNILERFIEDRFADGTDGGFEFINPRILGRPAGDDVHFGNTSVVALEKGQKVLCQIILIDIIQCANNAEIECDIAAIMGHQNIARMHVGVKEAVTEHLGEENLHAGTRQTIKVDAGFT